MSIINVAIIYAQDNPQLFGKWLKFVIDYYSWIAWKILETRSELEWYNLILFNIMVSLEIMKISWQLEAIADAGFMEKPIRKVLKDLKEPTYD